MKAIQMLMMKTIQVPNIKYGYLYNGYSEDNLSGVTAITSSDVWSFPTQTYIDSNDGFYYSFLISLDDVNPVRLISLNRISPDPDPSWISGTPFLTTEVNSLNLSLITKYVRIGGNFQTTYTHLFRVYPSSWGRRGYAEVYLYEAPYYAITMQATSFARDGLPVRLIRTATASELLLADGTYCDDYVGNDGKVYKTVKLHTKVWICYNLAETKLRNQTDIPIVSNTTTWNALNSIGMCAPNNNNSLV